VLGRVGGPSLRRGYGHDRHGAGAERCAAVRVADDHVKALWLLPRRIGDQWDVQIHGAFARPHELLAGRDWHEVSSRFCRTGFGPPIEACLALSTAAAPNHDPG